MIRWNIIYIFGIVCVKQIFERKIVIIFLFTD